MQFLKIESNFQHLPSLVMVTNPNHNSQIMNINEVSKFKILVTWSNVDSHLVSVDLK